MPSGPPIEATPAPPAAWGADGQTPQANQILRHLRVGSIELRLRDRDVVTPQHNPVLT